MRPVSSSHRRSVRPRDGYMNCIIERVKRMIMELYTYIRRNPIKVLFPIVMALISGGALHTIARKFGVTLPEGLAGLAGGGHGAAAGFNFERAFEGGRSGSGFGDMGSGGVLRGAMKIASTFL